MDRFELHMHKPGLNEHRDILPLLAKEKLELSHTFHHQLRRRGDEYGITRPRSADPVLTSAKLARRLVAATPVREKDLVYLANETQRERKSLPHALQPVMEGSDVLRDLLYVREGRPRRLLIF